ncbi:histidine phosphatase family protein [Sphingomonas sp. BIUV-7]|uniref:Histidine phosphatase family protein n=1 Tax=Sphingomonas natans TaxID=3063330 RepID=A0ABT8Y5Z5_9SPHN|nr:histidine phosphatase family protein [Sphingomonas sp. BIUV-7]MDO6413338.1 histidine phosphatase family protein [Sphingomonas sp. BIUV-7]
MSAPLYLMRHGEPILAGLMLGRTDCDATAAGIAACRDQGRELGPVRLISSDLRRARQCAEAIGVPRIDPRWRELDFGAWDGLAAAEIDAETLGRFWDDPDGFPPPGGERWSTLVGRVSEAIDALPEEPALVVTHGGSMRAALHILCGFDMKAIWQFDLPYGVMLGFHRWEGGAQIAGLWPCGD